VVIDVETRKKPLSPLSLNSDDDNDQPPVQQFKPLSPPSKPASNPLQFNNSYRPGGSGTKRTPTYLPTVEEPICVLNIELDGQQNEDIKIFEGDDPAKVVQEFGDRFNLSKNARDNLLEQIRE
jgi:hypothetical protein